MEGMRVRGAGRVRYFPYSCYDAWVLLDLVAWELGIHCPPTGAESGTDVST